VNSLGEGSYYKLYIPLICILFATLCSITFSVMVVITRQVDLVNAEIVLLIISACTTMGMLSFISRDKRQMKVPEAH